MSEKRLSLGFKFNFQDPDLGDTLTLVGHTSGILEIESVDFSELVNPKNEKLSLCWGEARALHEMLGTALAMEERLGAAKGEGK
ncbi:MAG: hypothetical protein V3S71_02715 [Acidobacteriota bacterium]